MAWAQGKGSLGLSPLLPTQKRSRSQRSDDLPLHLLVEGLLIEALMDGRLKSSAKKTPSSPRCWKETISTFTVSLNATRMMFFSRRRRR